MKNAIHHTLLTPIPNILVYHKALIPVLGLENSLCEFTTHTHNSKGYFVRLKNSSCPTTQILTLKSSYRIYKNNSESKICIVCMILLIG